MESHGHALPLIEDDKTRTQLQAVLQLSVTHCTPTISLSAPESSNPIEVTLTAKQKWSKKPTCPLTICTRHTPFDFRIDGRLWTGDSVSRHLQLRSISEPSKTLLGDPLANMWIHSAEPDRDDWQTHLGFITIPSHDSGQSYQITRHISRDALFRRSKWNPPAVPLPGEEYELELAFSRHFRIEWWNWGSLEDELLGKKLTVLPDPRVNGKGDRTPPGDPYLLPFACWEDQEDEEGNAMVFLEIEQDKTSVRVKIVE